MSFKLLRFSIVSMLTITNLSFAKPDQRIDLVRSSLAPNENGILIDKGKQIILVGEINATLATTFKKAVLEDREITSVVIDSQGGDVDSALDIAMVMKKHKLNLVVDGKCFSACANYLFPAAANKTVLPGSLLAIHEKTYRENNQSQQVSVVETEEKLSDHFTKKKLDEIKRLKQKEDAFLEVMGLNKNLHNAYLSFISDRDGSLKNGQRSSLRCQEVRMWGLNKDQLISMGVKGIGSFWFPANAEEKNMLYKYFKLPQGAIYFGEKQELERTCKSSLNK